MPTAVAGDGAGIYYETWGRRDGEPLLLIPGLTADLRIWACQRMVFGRRYRCIAVDNRGSGRSDKPPGPYSLAQMADDALAVLDAEGIGSAHVLGYSMGSFAAADLAVVHPERVRSLIMAGTTCRHHQWRRELLSSWVEVASTRGLPIMARRAFPWLVGPAGRRFGGWVHLIWPLILSQPLHAFRAQVDALLELSDDAAVGLGAITQPTLVLVGGEDRLTPPADAAEVAALIPGSRLAEIPGAGHGLLVEAAPDFNAAVLTFLAEAALDTEASALTGGAEARARSV
ncbi:MAG: alpha/beta fold hydrolase [Acidimicrobiia bacterium]